MLTHGRRASEPPGASDVETSRAAGSGVPSGAGAFPRERRSPLRWSRALSACGVSTSRRLSAPLARRPWGSTTVGLDHRVARRPLNRRPRERWRGGVQSGAGGGAPWERTGGAHAWSSSARAPGGERRRDVAGRWFRCAERCRCVPAGAPFAAAVVAGIVGLRRLDVASPIGSARSTTVGLDDRGAGRPWGWTTVGLDDRGAGRPWGWTTVGLDDRGAGRPWGWTTVSLDDR